MLRRGTCCDLLSRDMKIESDLFCSSQAASTSCRDQTIRPSGPFLASHTRIVLSTDPDTMRLPSGENETNLSQSSCPLRGGRSRSPVSASHITLTLPSPRAHTREKLLNPGTAGGAVKRYVQEQMNTMLAMVGMGTFAKVGGFFAPLMPRLTLIF